MQTIIYKVKYYSCCLISLVFVFAFLQFTVNSNVNTERDKVSTFTCTSKHFSQSIKIICLFKMSHKSLVRLIDLDIVIVDQPQAACIHI